MSSPLLAVAAVFLLGAITFLYRYSFVSGAGKKWAEKIPPGFLHLLAPAVFSAIVANSLLSPHSTPEEWRQKAIVTVPSLVLAYFSRSMVATVLFGLTLLYVLQHWAPGG